MRDIIIIGGGAAGISAAVAARARNKSVLIIGNAISTSSAYKAERIDNYPGMPGVTGKELLERFTEHAALTGVETATAKALQILDMGGYFSVNAGDSFYEARAVILAVGIARGGQAQGEKEFLGKGVSYCATCDGMLYRGKTVVVAGDNDEAISDARFLSEICEKIILLSEKSALPVGNEKMEFRKGKAVKINGDAKVSSVQTESETIPCDGVFIIRESIPAESLIYGLETVDGFIAVDKAMKTNISGVFAAGDCTGKPFQISKAVGDGLIAALSAVAYL